MHLAGVRQHVLDARGDRLLLQIADRTVRIQPEQHAVLREVVVRRVRELPDRQVRIEVAAEDLIVFLPEAAAHREPHLRAVAVPDRPHGFHDLGRQVHVELRDDRHRQAEHDVVGLHLRAAAARRVHVDHLHARVVLVHRLHVGVEGDAGRLDGVLECLHELVHAADRLEHRPGRRPLGGGNRVDAPGEVPSDDLGERIRLAGAADGERLVRVIGGIQIPGLHEKVDEVLLVLRRHGEIELVLIDRLHEQLVDVAGEIGLHLAPADALLRERPGGLTLVIAVVALGVVGERLDAHAQIAAVVQDAGVHVGNAPGPHVHVETIVERAHLLLATGAELGVRCTAAHRPVQSPDAVARLEDPEIVSQPAELVPQHEARDAGAEDQHLAPFRPAGERRPRAGLPGHQIPRLQGGHDQRGSADHAETFEKRASRQLALHAGILRDNGSRYRRRRVAGLRAGLRA